MTLPCWIISLNPASPTASALSAALTAQGVDHSFVPAVDGRQSRPALQGRERIDVRKSLIRHQKVLTNSELGVYLAHYRAIQRAFDEGLERVCIMEDDASLEPDFATVLKQLGDLPEHVEMVRMMALRIRKRKVVSPLPDGKHQLVRPERGWVGTQGYVITRKGMQKFLDHACNIFEPIDKVMDHFWEFDIKQYGVEPHILYEVEHTSTVQKKPPQPTAIPWHYRLAAPFCKLLFSIGRHYYLTRHRDEFYPAAKPEKRMGQTRRMH
jgi:glycosyl transferase family 25